jgi:hypothetical protein
MFLAFTSFPAGFLPFFTAGAYREMRHEQQMNSKWRNERKIESGREMLYLGLVLSVAALSIQSGMSRLAWRNWNGLLLGFRGAGWFAMVWGAFAGGVALGIWIYTVLPK